MAAKTARKNGRIRMLATWLRSPSAAYPSEEPVAQHIAEEHHRHQMELHIQQLEAHILRKELHRKLHRLQRMEQKQLAITSNMVKWLKGFYGDDIGVCGGFFK